MKKNLFLRIALLLAILTLITSSLPFTQARYVQHNIASDTEFRVFHLLPAIVHVFPARTSGVLNAADYEDFPNMPAGRWAFYVAGSSGANGGAPGVLRGIYTKASASTTFRIGMTGEAWWQGSGGAGGPATYLFDGLSGIPAAAGGSSSNSPTADQTASLAGIVAVAGGGGGVGASGSGGNAGGSGTQNGPFDTSTGIMAGWQGNNSSQTDNRSGQHGGGGEGRQWNWWRGGERGGDSLNSATGATSGGWFTAGRATTSSGFNAGSGGGGIFGGGGGAARTAIAGGSGSGGGGASYIITGATPVPTTRYENPTTYYQHAVNYFIDTIEENAGNRRAILVWLGPVDS